MNSDQASRLRHCSEESSGSAKDFIVVCQEADLGFELFPLSQPLTGGSAVISAIGLRLQISTAHALLAYPSRLATTGAAAARFGYSAT